MDSNYLIFSGYYISDKESKREKAVSAALTLLAAEARAGIGVDQPKHYRHDAKVTKNPIKKYADWIEEALEMPDGKSNPPPASE